MEWDNFDYSRTKEMRDRFIPLEKVIDFVSLENNASLIDMGAGDGHYSIAFALKFPDSHITALEPGLNGSKLIRERIKSEKIQNVEVLEKDACTLKDYSNYGVVFFSNVFHDLPCRDGIAAAMGKTMRPGSKVVFIEFKKEADIGPPKEIRIEESTLKALMEANNAKLSGSAEFKYHYMHKYIINQKT
ncbi:MAG: class I SAM-dependent methyltransferase [Candidatus Marsarchaeota archaeon]|nr:class I SAM-dependent methyltransferase [Candidatus Marsarchaeota archaeon]